MVRVWFGSAGREAQYRGVSMSSSLRVVLTLIVAAVTFVSLPESAQALGQFSDDDGNIHESAIEAIAAAGITKGCNPPTNDRFCPDSAVTRGEMATFLTRALSLAASGVDAFGDDDDSVHEANIQALAVAGITKGCDPPTNDRFCPDSAVTRGEMATFLTRALSLAASGVDAFGDDDDSVHEANIQALAVAGITKGCNPPTNDQYCPNKAVSRAEMATFLTRALGLTPIVPLPPQPVDNDAALIDRYHVMDVNESPSAITVWDMQYWPRSFASGLDIDPDPDGSDFVDDAGSYSGWDVLAPSTSWEFKNLGKDDDWLRFTLNRPAQVAVAWRGGLPIPSWLNTWTSAGFVYVDGDTLPVYEKAFAAGPAALGSVEGAVEWRDMYLVLLAEDNGSPTPKPAVPNGYSTPTPGTACPSWVHELYRTTGPDGDSYLTWHPQIDPVYWCSFGHEHGSNPDLIPGSPKVPYEYLADKLGASEPNVGFKEFTFKTDDGNHWVRFVVHAGTGSQRRVCAQFHTLYIQAYDADGTEVYNVGFKADYGAAIATGDTGGEVLTPTNCGYDMQALANSVDFRQRSINVGAQSNNYERWESRNDSVETRNLGIAQFDHEFDIRNPVSHCANQTCNSVVKRDSERENATRRTLSMATWKANFLISAQNALASGEFFTDPYGEAFVSAGASNATRQYVAPGLSIGFFKNTTANRIECKALDPWTFEYTCYQIGGAGNLDHIGHVPDLSIEHALTGN